MTFNNFQSGEILPLLVTLGHLYRSCLSRVIENFIGFNLSSPLLPQTIRPKWNLSKCVAVADHVSVEWGKTFQNVSTLQSQHDVTK